MLEVMALDAAMVLTWHYSCGPGRLLLVQHGACSTVAKRESCSRAKLQEIGV